MGDKLGQVSAMKNGRSVVESRTSMVDGTSPLSVVNTSSKEAQDRYTAALALTGLHSLPHHPVYPVINHQNQKKCQNGYQHVPIQALPVQPGRSTMGHAVAVPKQATKSLQGAVSVPKPPVQPPPEIHSTSAEKKKPGRGKKSAQGKDRVSRSLTIAQLYQQGADESEAKNRPLEEKGLDKQNDGTASVRMTSQGPPVIHVDTPTTGITQIQPGVPMKRVLTKPHDSQPQPLRLGLPTSQTGTVIGLTVVSSANNLGQPVGLPVHVLPASMANSNRGVIRPTLHSSNQFTGSHPNLPYIIQPVLSGTSTTPTAVVAITQAGVTFNKPIISTGVKGISHNNASNVTSVDITTLNLPTNAPVTAVKANTDASKRDSSIKPASRPRSQARKEKVKPLVSQVPRAVSEYPEPSKELISNLALSNIEDKNKPLSVKQMISMSALSYLSSSGPVKMPHFPPGLMREIPGSNSGPSGKKMTLPMTIAEGPPNRSSLMEMRGKSTKGTGKSNASAPFEDMFPLSNHNPLLPRVFHSFMPTKHDPEMQPTDLSVKKTTSQQTRNVGRAGFKGNDQPEDLSMSTAKKNEAAGNMELKVTTANTGILIQPKQVVSAATRNESRASTTVGLNIAGGSPSFTRTSDAAMTTQAVSSIHRAALHSDNPSTLMPPLVKGIPIPMLHSFYVAQQRAGGVVTSPYHIPGTTVESLPAVIMSTGKNQPGSQPSKLGPTTATIESHNPNAAAVDIAKSKQVVATADIRGKDQLPATITSPVSVNTDTSINDSQTAKSDNRVKMIGTCPVVRDGGDMPLHTDIARNRLPPKKRKLLYQDDDEAPVTSKVPRTSDFPPGTAQIPPEDARDSSPTINGTPAITNAKSSENEEIQESRSGPSTPPSGSASPGARSTDSPVQVDPRMNLIMLRECHMAVKPDEDGDLPLHIAVVQGDSPVVDRLIPMMQMLKSPVDHYNNLRQTPLHLAVITKSLDISKKLLCAGASPNLPDRKGQSSIHLCVIHSFLEGLHALIASAPTKPDLDAKNYEGLTPLHLAVQRGKVDFVGKLIDSNAEIDSMDGKSGKTPLYFAAELNQDQIVRVLLEKGANVNIPNYSGNTPMSVANAKGYYTQVVNLLLKYGADPGTASAPMSAAPSPTVEKPFTLVRNALKESLSKEGKSMARGKSRVSPPGSAPGTPRPRKRKGKQLEAQPPSKLVRSASYDPSMGRGGMQMPGSPLVSAAHRAPSPRVPDYAPYSPITPASSVGSPRDTESDQPRTSQPALRPLPPLALIEPPQSTLALTGARLTSAVAMRQGTPIASPSGTRLQPSAHMQPLSSKPSSSSAPPSQQPSPSGPYNPGQETVVFSSVGPEISQPSSLTSIPHAAVVSESEGKLVLTVPVELDVNKGQPLPKQILPPIVKSPSSSKIQTGQRSELGVVQREHIKKQSIYTSVMKSAVSPQTVPVETTTVLPANVSKETTPPHSETVEVKVEIDTLPSLQTSQIKVQNVETVVAASVDLSSNESSDSFMIDESNTESCNDSGSPGNDKTTPVLSTNKEVEKSSSDGNPAQD